MDRLIRLGWTVRWLEGWMNEQMGGSSDRWMCRPTRSFDIISKPAISVRTNNMSVSANANETQKCRTAKLYIK